MFDISSGLSSSSSDGEFDNIVDDFIINCLPHILFPQHSSQESQPNSDTSDTECVSEFEEQSYSTQAADQQQHFSRNMALAKGVCLNHIARESADIKRLATFYQQVLGFEQIESPKYGEFEVIWMKLPPSFSLHLIQRNPATKLPEGPYSAQSPVKDPMNLPRGHHVSFAVSNFDEFVHSLKEKGIETFEKTQPDGKTKQVFFFDPDGNGLEVGNFGTQSE